MANANSITEKELIKQQLDQAKETLHRLREISDVPKQNDNNIETGRLSREHDISREFANNDLPTGRHSGRNSSSPRPGSRPRNISTTARDNLVHALGFQVSKLEDDLKVSLLSYFEQIEKQKEDLIDSFNIMQQQLIRHQEMCQEQTKEVAEKEQAIRDLESSKLDLELELDRVKVESQCADRLDTSAETFPELLFSPSPGAESHNGNSGYFENGKPDMSEKLLQENTRLRELLQQQDGCDYLRLERKVQLQENLCSSYDKDISSKDRLIKRLQAENRGCQSDVQAMQDEILRVNANRLNAEQDKSKLQQELQFCEEQIFTMREKVAKVCDENDFLSRTISDANANVETREGDVSRLKDEIAQLERKCDTYKDKLNDKEKHIVATKKDSQGKDKMMEAMKKELAAARSEAQRLKREHERLQRENADREIDRLQREGLANASNSKLNQLREQVSGSTQKMEELRRRCDELEKREAELSQEVLSSLEKYTHAEQELYLTKKELAQQRGHNESAEKRRKDAEAGLEGARKRIADCEREMRGNRENRNRNDMRDAKLESLQAENEQLKDENSALEEAIKNNKLELEELEQALNNSREHNSIQGMRLEGNDAMMQRKDAKIKELQEELVEVHHQNDALTDELLKKNRDVENLKMAKLLAEQELELIKTGVLPGRHSSASNRDRDSALFAYREPATPDSGFAEVDAHLKGKEREKAIEQLRKEMMKSHGKFEKRAHQGEEGSGKGNYPGKEDEPRLKAVLEEELSDVVAENDVLRKENTDMKSKLGDTQKKLSDIDDRNRTLEQREDELTKMMNENVESEQLAVTEIQRKLTEMEEENQKLRDREKELKYALENSELLTPSQDVRPEEVHMEVLENLESNPGMDLWNFGMTDNGIKPPMNETIVEQDLLQLESVAEGGIINFQDPSRSDNIKELEEANDSLRNENEDLLKKVTCLVEDIKENNMLENALREENGSLKEDNKELAGEVEHLKNVKNKEREREREIKTIKKENDSLKEVNKELEGKVKQLKDNVEDKEREIESEVKTYHELEDGLKTKNEELNEKVKQLEKDMKSWEKRKKESNAEKNAIENELEETYVRAEKAEAAIKATKQKNEEVNKQSSDETAAKDLKILELQKDWDKMNENCNELKSEVRKAKEVSSQQQEEMLRAQAELVDLERKINKHNKRQQHLGEQLKQAEQSECSLLTELGETKTKQRRLEKEVNTLKQDAALAEDAAKEKDKANKTLEKRSLVLADEKHKAEEKIDALENEKREVTQQVKRIQAELAKLRGKYEELEDEKEQIEESMNDVIREKSREVRDLEADLEMSEQKCEGLKSSWNNTELVTSDLQGELLKAKEEAIDAHNECERLSRVKEDLEEELQEREKQLDNCKQLEEDLRNGINGREKELEILRCNIEEEEYKMRAMKDENLELSNAVQVAREQQKQLESFIQKIEEDKDQAMREKQAAHDSIADLETAFEKSEDENLNAIAKLAQAEKQISILQQKGDMFRREVEEAEDAHSVAESKAKELERQLQKNRDDMSYLESKLELAESKSAAMEKEIKNKGEKEQSLQQNLLDAMDNIKDLEDNEKESKARLRSLENKLGELKQYNEQLETERDEMEYKAKELKKKLSNERERVEELEDELASRKYEKNAIKQEVEMLNATLTETDAQQTMGMNEREKLKKEWLEASNKVLELETTCEVQNENIEELEKLLDQKRAKVVDLEDNLKESSEKITDLQTQADELSRTMRVMKEDNVNLEKMLEKQKQLSTGYKNGLSQRDAEIAKLSEKRDSAETALQFTKKDLARREGIYKAHEDELEETEKQLANSTKKLQEMKANNERVIQENEKLKRDVEAIKRRMAELEGMQVENAVVATEVEGVQSASTTADTKIKCLDVKLSHAQNKVTDLEHELSKEIRKHEMDCIKTRPNLPGKRSSYYDYDEGGVYPKYGGGAKRESSGSDWERNSSIDDLSDTSSSYSVQGKPRPRSALKRGLQRGSQEGEGSGGESRGSLINVNVQGELVDTPPTSPLLLGDKKPFLDLGGGGYGSGNESDRSAKTANQPLGPTLHQEHAIDDMSGGRHGSGDKPNGGSQKANVQVESATVTSASPRMDDKDNKTESARNVLETADEQIATVITPNVQVLNFNDEVKADGALSVESGNLECLRVDQEHDANTSQESSVGDADASLENNVGKLNDLITEMNQGNQLDPFMEPFIVDHRPAGTSSPHMDHPDAKRPTSAPFNDPNLLESETMLAYESEPVQHEAVMDPFSTSFDIQQSDIYPLNDSFDIIQPTYTATTQADPLSSGTQAGPFSDPFEMTPFDSTTVQDEHNTFIIQPPADELLNFGPTDTANTSASGITNVTTLSEVNASQEQLPLNQSDQLNLFDQFDGANNGTIHEHDHNDAVNNPSGYLINIGNETTDVFDNDVINPFAEPFSVPTWDESFSDENRGDSERTAEFGDDLVDDEMNREPVVILINDKVYDHNDEEHENLETIDDEDENEESQHRSVNIIETKEDKPEDFTDLDQGNHEGKDAETIFPKTVRFDFSATESTDEKPQYTATSFEESGDISDEETSSDKDIERVLPKGTYVQVLPKGVTVKDFAQFGGDRNSGKARNLGKFRFDDNKSVPEQESTVKSFDFKVEKKQQGSHRSTKAEDSDEDEQVSRKPSDIIKQFEGSFKDGSQTWQSKHRPKTKRSDLPHAEVKEDTARVPTGSATKPEPKPRTKIALGNKMADGEGGVVAHAQRPASPRGTRDQGGQDLALEVVDKHENEEERSLALGRERVMKLIAAFEGKEV